MEQMLKQFLDIGVIGVIAYVCFKTVLEDKKKSEELIQKEREEHKQEIKEITNTYKEELKKDRETYVNSINLVSQELKEVRIGVESVSNAVKEIEIDMKTFKDKVGGNYEFN